MNPRVRFKSQEKGALYGIGDHDSHLKQDMEVEKETQLEHTHHVNPPLLSAHRGRSILNAFCKQHNAKELHWQQQQQKRIGRVLLAVVYAIIWRWVGTTTNVLMQKEAA